jgi:hypothetical protein
VINLYDAGKLDVTVLDILAKVFKGSDIDLDGQQGLTTKDGKLFIPLCVEMLEPHFTSPTNPEGFESEEEEYYWKFSWIKSKRWGWQ